MKIIHNGKAQEFTLNEWWNRWDANPGDRVAIEVMAREGAIFTDGEQLSGRTLQRVRDRLLRTYADLPERTSRRQEPGPRRFLVPGLWAWGTIPAMGGNYKAGKSTVVTDLTRALVVPGYRFLDHFEPADLNDEDRNRGVVVVNAETPPEDFEAALSIGMTSSRFGEPAEGWDLLTVEHLEDHGGAQLMDLTDPDLYDLWADRLAECWSCDGSDDWTPAVVVVDGVTAILQAAGKDPDDFGLWFAKFRLLLREIDVPNGLSTGHNTMRGGHLMGGTAASAGPDGLWTYSTDQIDKLKSARRFSVQPRMGGVQVPLTRVVLSEDGRPMVRRKDDELEKDEGPDLVTAIAHRHVAYVREHPGASGQELTENVEDGGWKENNLKGRSKALELGLIRVEKCRSGCTLCKKSHPRRSHYWPV